jgi:tetratricopeptide (TPR) repeat protein
MALMRYALEVALEYDKPSAALRAHFNLADSLARIERFEEAAAEARDGLALARRVGNRNWEWFFLGQVYPLFSLGEWDEVLELQSHLPEEGLSLARLAFASGPVDVVPILVHRGELEAAQGYIDRLVELDTSADVQERVQYGLGKARALLAHGDAAAAQQAALETWEIQATVGISSEAVKEAFVVAVEASLELGDTDKAAEQIGWVDALPPGRSPQFLQAQAARFRATLAAAAGEAAEAERLFKQAAGRFRELSIPFSLAVAQLEHAEWLVREGRKTDAEPLFAEASEIFSRLRATPWLERLATVAGSEVVRVAT